jgi:hypothetical protein
LNLSTGASWYRGKTLLLQVNFYDFFGNLVQPSGGFINVQYPDPSGAQPPLTMLLPLTPGTPWTAVLDTRNMGLGEVYCSAHSNAPVPVAVGETMFTLIGNPANLQTF